MSDAPYSKREQDTYRREVLDFLGRIEAQTIKTNGRVSALERWQSYVLGAVAVLLILVIPIGLALLDKVI